MSKYKEPTVIYGKKWKKLSNKERRELYNKYTENKKQALFEKNLIKLGESLNQKVPKSELWFRGLYSSYKHQNNLYNKPLSGYIPDVYNPLYKYIIEIDGSVHNNIFVKEKDIVRDEFFKKKGYKVFRIQFNNKSQFNIVLQQILKIREEYEIIS